MEDGNLQLTPPETIAYEPSKTWYVIRTKARCEKKLARYLSGCNIHFFLPLRRSIKYYQKRKATFFVPMFSGYIFSQMTVEEELQIRQSGYVASVIRPDTHAETQLIQDLNDVKLLIEATLEGEIVVRPEIQEGDTVYIKGGPFMGLNGIVSRWKSKTRITVNVEMVGQSITMEIDASEVEVDY